eukprot:11668179-Ditylum_brightwellii.AAC.1
MVVMPVTVGLVEDTTEASIRHGESSHVDSIVAAFVSAEGALRLVKFLLGVTVHVALCSRTVAKEGVCS